MTFSPLTPPPPREPTAVILRDFQAFATSRRGDLVTEAHVRQGIPGVRCDRVVVIAARGALANAANPAGDETATISRPAT
jgi:hypothetical protein